MTDDTATQGPASQDTGRSGEASAPTGTGRAAEGEQPAEASETMAQQVLDALASIGGVISAGVPASSHRAAPDALGGTGDRASLRLSRTVQSYFVF